MKKTNKEYLKDLLEYIDRAIDAVADISEDEFSKDVDSQDMLYRRIHVIGEISKRIPQGIKDRHKDVPWRQMAGIRDVLSHDYDGVDMSIVYRVAKVRLTRLRPIIEEMLYEEPQ